MASRLPVAETPNALDTHKQSIQEIIEDAQTDAQIVAILFRRGVQTSKKSLRRSLQFWVLRRPQNVINGEMVKAVKYVFHHTTLNDAKLQTEYLQTKSSQSLPDKKEPFVLSTGSYGLQPA